MSDLKQRHDEVVRELARSYEARGFTVQVEADIGKGRKADLLAKRGAETVLIEVKVASSSPADRALPTYAELAQRNGWRFVIAVADAKNVDEIEIPTAEVVHTKVAEAKALPPGSDAAVLTAWAVLESAARLALVRSGRRVGRSTTPKALVQELATLGRLTMAEERDLLSFVATRNRLAHGFWDAAPAHTAVSAVLALSERLLSDETAES